MAAEMRALEQCIPMNSKRNDVRRCQWDGEAVVVKDFAAFEDYSREKAVYENLLQIAPQLCPRVIGFDDQKKELILKYISGATVLEELESAEKENDQAQGTEILTRLLDWMQDFYESQKAQDYEGIRGDINLRNFLWVEQRVIGIDFEGCCAGNPADEVLQVIAFYLLYEPERTAFKLSVVRSIIDPLLRMTNRSVLLFWETLDEEMAKIRVRRNQNKLGREIARSEY